MHPRIMSLPDRYQARMEEELRRRGYSLTEPRRLAEAVLRLSDHYTQNPDAASPWTETWAQAASIAYYFPLNYARNAAVFREARRLGFFDGITSVADIGSGMGAALFACRDAFPALERIAAYDISREAMDLGFNLRPENFPRYEQELLKDEGAKAPWSGHQRGKLVTASYVFTELPEIPSWWLDADALAIVEPSTQDDGRRLMAQRELLIANGFSLWAPCTHQGACPLFIHSEKDWCHDRIHWAAPAWWESMEKHLPMKNRTLTFSYLLARKAKPAPNPLASLARLTGDMLIEKGKTRQSVCRGEDREFLAWFPQRMKKDESIALERGSLARLAEGLEKKSAEVRLKSPQDIQELDADHVISGQD